MRFGGTCLAAVLCGFCASIALGDEPAPRPDFSVLTPAIEGKFLAATGVDLTSLVPPYVGFAKIGTGGRSGQLRKLVEREGYDPTQAIADRVIDALAAASYTAVHEPISRRRAGLQQSLSWDDLPERPQGELMLDLTVRWICLCADVAFAKHYPAISISWRLLHPAGEVVEPSRTLTYHHFPAWYAKNQAATPYPPENVTDTCGFTSVKSAEENPAVLWGCFGEAYAAAARRLVIDLARLHPPRAPATASSGSPSGTSRR